jgi:hypothetical protein
MAHGLATNGFIADVRLMVTGMCTITFIARKKGYALGMNRDEQRARVVARPPARQELSGCAALFPSEPGGGTWIGVNDAGVSLALINWYSIPGRVSANAISRGWVVRRALAFDSKSQIEENFKCLPLPRINPFRLISIFPQNEQVIEWRWNLSRLDRIEHEWKTNIWVSSGFDEPGAEKTRRETFLSALRSQSRHDLSWLRQLHASHLPTPGPYSVCMHRSDAVTVSYTEIVVGETEAQMSYSSGPLCCGSMVEDPSCELPLARRIAGSAALLPQALARAMEPLAS